MVLMAALVWGLSSCNNDDDLDIDKFNQLRSQGTTSGSVVFQLTPLVVDLTEQGNMKIAHINTKYNNSWYVDSKSEAFNFSNFSVSPMSGAGSQDLTIRGLSPQYPECYNKIRKALTVVSRDNTNSISIQSYEPNPRAFKLMVESLTMGGLGDSKATRVITYDTDSWEVLSSSPALTDITGLKVTPTRGTGPQTITISAPAITNNISYYKPVTKDLLITNGNVTRACTLEYYEAMGDIKVSPTSLFFAMSFETQKVKISVEDNQKWFVSSNSTILDWKGSGISPLYGTGSGEISVTVQASGNVNSPTETGTLIISTGGKSATVTVQRYKP